MLRAVDVARYFINKDKDGLLFNKELVHMNGRDFYSGNAKLNKFLHLAQNIYIAKTGEKLFDDDLYAYDNGAVAPSVQENYAILLKRRAAVSMPQETTQFLDKVFRVLRNASLEELIDLSHEDSEWLARHSYFAKAEQRMNSLSRADEYRIQYKDILKVMDRLS